jgi:hypothetical protein
MSDYPSQLADAYTKVTTQKNLPELFCRFIDAVQTVPPEILSAESTAVQSLFNDVNSAIQQYNRQFQLLINELGVLCKTSPQQATKVQAFFTSLLDLFRLAYTVYENDPTNLPPFQELLQKILVLLDTSSIDLQQETPFQKALLVQLVTSAWALTNTRQSMEQVVKETKQQAGGNRKRKTRKQRKA